MNRVLFSGRISKLVEIIGKKKDVEKLMGISHSQLHNIEAGTQKITPNHIAKLEALEKKYGLKRTHIDDTLAFLISARLESIYEALGTWNAVEKAVGISFEQYMEIKKAHILPPEETIREIAGYQKKEDSTADQVADAISAAKLLSKKIERIETECSALKGMMSDLMVKISFIPRVAYDPLLYLLEARLKELNSAESHDGADV